MILEFKEILDKKDSNRGDVKGNLIHPCYWCNNAITDEFSLSGFKPIGVIMGDVLRQRLENKF